MFERHLETEMSSLAYAMLMNNEWSSYYTVYKKKHFFTLNNVGFLLCHFDFQCKIWFLKQNQLRTPDLDYSQCSHIICDDTSHYCYISNVQNQPGKKK